MFCPKCGTQNPDDGRFCRKCGADLGNVSAALSGNAPRHLQYTVDPRKRGVSWETAITKIFSGLAFLVVSIILGMSGMAGGRGWWFWLLIPAFGALGSGVAQFVQLKKLEKREAGFMPPNTQNVINSAPQNNALPPTQTDYVAPPKQSIYDTGDLAERPGSVTEGTTRHLQMDSEGETMTLPKK
jgi:hypothetical protein